ncbi:MAG: Transcriptional regulator, partial [Candidatus Wolfebacteria bacterium GW2011_GWC1_37_10]
SDDQKNFQEFFREALELRGMTIEKLVELTGISRHALAAIYNGDYKKMPSLPYLRGYLMKIAEILGIDGNQMWQTYKDEINSKISIEDKLPHNRFAIKPKSLRKLVIGIIAVSVIIYLVFRIDNLLGIPKIEIINPLMDSLEINEERIKLEGKLDNYWDKLTINNEEIFVNEDGYFEKDFQLLYGENNIEFKVKRFLGKEVKLEKKVIYQPLTQLPQ